MFTSTVVTLYKTKLSGSVGVWCYSVSLHFIYIRYKATKLKIDITEMIFSWKRLHFKARCSGNRTDLSIFQALPISARVHRGFSRVSEFSLMTKRKWVDILLTTLENWLGCVQGTFTAAKLMLCRSVRSRLRFFESLMQVKPVMLFSAKCKTLRCSCTWTSSNKTFWMHENTPWPPFLAFKVRFAIRPRGLLLSMRNVCMSVTVELSHPQPWKPAKELRFYIQKNMHLAALKVFICRGNHMPSKLHSFTAMTFVKKWRQTTKSQT